MLATTALQAGAVLVLVFPAPVLAQTPFARPTGGRVVAGQAGIQQNTTATTVSQSSQRAAVDWTSYDIGSQHTVIYQQPNASSITLNRVTGPDPSQIAGKIIANGQVAIVNPSGVLFHAGSVVDVQSLMVSSANINNRNFMAGRMVFDQPGRPDAKISNAGSITVKETGLAALVAPQVANTGIITARMGHVVLAAGEAHTVDLYGDGLMSVDVTREVRHTPAGQTALVTNTGTIVADGGTILLTAKAADGIMQNLVSARGKLQANSVGDKTGTVVVAAIGGSVTIEGTVEAAGRAPGTRGGTVQVAATDTVNIDTSARIIASGRAGGGVVALGTTPARALAQGTPAGAGIPTGTSRLVRVAAGAKVKADATENGTGGMIALLSTERTSVAGALSARGGRVGGNGGRVEISSAQTVGLTGTVDTAAPAGKAGTTLLDPATINIGGDVDSASGADPETISAGAFNALTGNVVIAATGTVSTPASSINLIPGSSTALAPTAAQSVTLTTDAGGTINVNVSLTTTGITTLSLIGGTAVNVNAPLSSATSLSLAGGTISVNSALTGTNRVSLQADTLTFGSGGSVTTTAGTVAVAPLSTRALVIDDTKPTGSLSLSTGDVSVLAAAAPATIVLGDVSATPSAATATASSIALNTTTTPALDLSANPVSLGLYSTGDITQTGTIRLNTAAPTFTAAAGDRVLLGLANAMPSIGPVSGTQVTLGVTGATTIAGTVAATTAAGTLGNGQVAISGDASVTTSAAVSASTSLALVGSTINVNSALTAPNRVSLQADTLTFGGGSVTTTAGTVAVAPLSTRALVIDDTKPSGSLSLSTGDVSVLAAAAPATIVLGDVSATPSAATATASSIALNTTTTPALDLSANPVSLGLYSTGDITQTGTIRLNTAAPTFTAAAGDRVLLGLANAMPSIGPVSGTQVTLGVTGATTIAGTVAATTAAGTLGNGQVAISGDASVTTSAAVSASTSLALVGSTINVNSALTAPNRVSLQADTLTFGGGSVTTTAGTVAVAPLSTRALVIDDTKPSGSLSLSTGDVSVLAAAAPATIVLGDVSATPSAATATASSVGLNTTTTPALDLSANPVSLGLYATGDITQSGTIRLNTAAPTFTAAAGDRVLLGLANVLPSIGPVSGTQVTLGVTGATTIAGTVAATTASGKLGNGQVAISGDAAVAVTGTVQSAGGDVAVSGSPLTVSGTVSASMAGMVTLTSTGALTLSGTVGGDGATTLVGTSIAVNAGAFIEAGRTGASAVNGTVTFQNALTLNGGTVAANTVATQTVLQTGGTLAANKLTTTDYTFSGGALATGNAIEVSAAGLPAGSSISAAGLTIDATGSSFTAAGTATSSADLHIVLPGSFNQTGGTIAASGALTIAGSAAGTTGAPGTVSQSAGTLAAGTTLLLYGLDPTAPTIAGTIEAATVQVLAPNAALTFQPGALSGAPAAFTSGGYTLTLICPNCGTGTPSVAVTAPTLTAGTGAPDMRLDGATLSLPGTLTVGRLELHSVGNTTQSGAITADTLTGSAGFSATTTAGALPTYTTAAPTAGSVTLNNTANAIGNLGSYTVAKGDATTRGAFTLTDSRALAIAAGSVVTASDVSINTGASALTVSGSIGACAIDVATGGTLTLTTLGALALAGTVGGERSTSLSGGTVAVNSGAFVEAGRSGASPLDGTITVSGPLSLSGGVVAANTVTAGTIGQTAGSLVTSNLTTTGYTFSGGTLVTGGAVALSSGGIAAGSVVSAAGLTVTATGAAGSTFSTAGTLYSSGDLSILLPTSGPSNFSQTGGILAAGGTVTVAGNAAGTAGASGTISQSGGTIAAGSGIVLYGLGAGAASLVGTLAAPSVQVLEPGAPVSFAPATLAGNAGLTAPGYTLSLHCPGCDATAPSLSTTGLGLTPTGTAATVRVDGATVSLGSVFAAGTLELHSVGDTTQSAAFTAATLQGTAGYTPVTGAGRPTYASAGSGIGSATLTLGNAITALSLYQATGGIAVRSTTSLTTFDQIVAGGNQTVALTAPSLTLNDQIRFGTLSNSAFATNSRPFGADSGTFVAATVPATATAFDRVMLKADTIAINAAVTAPGGELDIVPLTAGTALSVDAPRATGHLSLTAGDLAFVNVIGPAGTAGPQLLQLGSVDGTTKLAGSITLNTAVALTNTAATLGLYATGDVTEAAGVGITIGRQAGPGLTGTITGAAGGTVQLGTATDPAPVNSFDVLGPFAAGSGLSVSNIATANAGRSGLKVTGTVSTSLGDLSLLDAGAVLSGTLYSGGTIALNGTVSAPGQVTLKARDGSGNIPAITTASGGRVLAGTLTGSAMTTDTGVGYDVLLNGSANQVTTLGAFTVGSSPTAQGSFTLTDNIGLAVSGPVLASAVTLSAPGITIDGAVSALVAGGSGGGVALTATGAAGTVAMQSGAVGGQTSLTVAALGGLSVMGGVMDAPTVTLTGNTSLTVSGGTLFGETVTVGGTVGQSGGVLHARTLNRDVSFSGGDLYAGNGLGLVVSGPTVTGRVVTPGNLSVSGSGITSTATLLAGGTLGINDNGTFTQTAGTIASQGMLTVAAAGVVNQFGGAMLSGSTLLLRAAGTDAASLRGDLGGGTVQIVEPNAPLVFAPTSLSGGATVSAGTLVNSYLPNAQTTTVTGAGATAGPNRSSTLLVDGSTLALGSGTVVLAADTIELHSAGATSQPGGSLQASSLSGTAGYAGTFPALPGLPDYTALTSSGIAVATVTLDRAANNIAAITGYQVAGDTSAATATAGLVVTDTPGAQTSSTGAALSPTGLTLSNLVRAGVAGDPLTATAELISGKDVAITTTGNLVVGGTVAGRTVELTAGAITEPGGLVVANTLMASSGTGISLQDPNQVANLGLTTARIGDITFVNYRNLVVSGTVSAPVGAVSIKAADGTGTASATEPSPVDGTRAAATGDLTIAATPAGSASTITGRTVALAGTDVILNGTVGASLVAGAGGTVSIAASGTPVGSSVATAPGTITSNAGSVVGGKVGVGLTAPGGTFVQGGTLDAPAVTFASTTAAATVSPTLSPTLTLSSGQVYGNAVTVTGAALETGGLLATNALTLTGGLTFTNGTLYAGGSGTLALAVTGPSLTGSVTTSGSLAVSGANLTSTADLLAGGALTITDAGTFTQSAGTIAGAGVTVTAAGLVDQSGGALESTGTLLLRGYGTGNAAITGQLAGQTIEVIEPGAAVVFAPTAFASGDPTHPLRGAARLSATTLTLDYICPGCTPLTIDSLTVGTTTAATPGAYRPNTLRVDGGSVTLGGPLGSTNVLAADAIVLHSQTFTTQRATAQTAAASLETATLGGSAGYAASSAVLPDYAVPTAQTRSGGYGISAAANGATVTLDNAVNNVAVVSNYQVRGDDASRRGLTLRDQPAPQMMSDGTTTLAANGLLVTGTVRSGPAADPLDASAAQATGNDTMLQVSGAGQSLQIGNASNPGSIVGGRTVSLTADGDITEGAAGATNAGAIVAGTLTASAGGNVQLATAGGPGQIGNQIAVLSSIAAGSGAVSVQDSRTVTVIGPISAATGITLSAQNGAGTPSAAEGQSAGNLTLGGTVATVAGNVALTAYGTLSGASVSAPATVTLQAGGDVNVRGISANLLTGRAGRSFTAAGAFPNLASVAASSGLLSITDGSALSLGGVSSGATGATLTAPSMTLAGDLYAGGTLRLQATSAGITQNAGTVAATGPVLLTGASDTAALPGGITQNAGTLASNASVTLLSSGDTAQGAAGTVAAPIVQVVSQNGTNTFGASQSAQVTAAGTATPGSVSLTGRPVSVRLDGQTVTLMQLVAADTVTLHAANGASEAPGSAIVANVLTGTTGYASSGTDGAGLPTYATLNAASPGSGGATLLSSGNVVFRLGDFLARSGLAFNDATNLVIGGTVRGGVVTDALTGAAVSASGAAVGITLTGAGSTLSIGDAASPAAVLAGSTVTLVVPGVLSEAPGALVAAGTLTGSASTANLSAASNQVVQLGAFTTGGDFTLVNGRDLSVTGAVVAGPNPPGAPTPVLTLGVSGGLDLNGGSLTGGTVAITAAGAVTETAGSIAANTLSLAASQVTANSAVNNINVLSSVVAPGGIAFTDAASLTTTGPVRADAGPITLQVGGSLVTTDVVSSSGAVTFGVSGNATVAAASTVSGASVTTQSAGTTTVAGTVTAQGTLSVAANGVTFAPTSVVTAASATVDAGGGTLVQNGTVGVSGTLDERAGTITQAGQVSAGAALTQTAAGTAFIAGTTTASFYALTAGASATLAGVESAPLIRVTAPSIGLASGTINTGGVPQNGTTLVGNLPTVRTAGLGFFLEAGSRVVQTGQTIVRPIAGSSQATVRVDLTAGTGSIAFASLSAPQANLILDIGTGTAAGRIDVHALTVRRIGTELNSTGSTDLLGVVGGLPGTAAAGVSAINTPGRDYRINACAISSVNCVILRPQVVPVGDPLKELVLNFFRDQDGDENLLLPNVTDQGL